MNYDKERPLSEQNISSDQIKDLGKLYEDLITESYFRLDEIMNDNSKHIQDIFASQNFKKPKIVIKTVDKDSVVDIYRSQKEGPLAYFKQSLISLNTGFSKIVNDNQEYFLCNNLQTSYIKGKYANPRLKPLSDEISKKLINKEIAWSDLWEAFDDGSKQAYLSTLIIPMKISKDDLKSSQTDEDFEKIFFNDNKKTTLWGFLCIDHPDDNYFTKDVEASNVGYIIADIISLYLMFFYNHISGSKTIEVYNSILNRYKINES